jgi:hypothetical protein
VRVSPTVVRLPPDLDDREHGDVDGEAKLPRCGAGGCGDVGKPGKESVNGGLAVINGSLLFLGQRNGGKHALQVLPGFEELGLSGDLGADVAGGDRGLRAWRRDDRVARTGSTLSRSHNVLTQSSDPELAVANIERPKVIYNSKTGKYVMWMHKENGSDYTQARRRRRVRHCRLHLPGQFRPPTGTTSRGMTLFKDDDGTAYQITSANNNADLQIFKLSADHTSYGSLAANPWPGTFREAPALFKRSGVYFMLTSGNSGWKPNQQRYATATSITGPWTVMTDVGDDTAYGSQTAFVLPVQGTQDTSYLYMGDRGGNSMGGTVNDSHLPWYPQIAVDTDIGTIGGAGGGPYYKLIARHSGKRLDVANASTANGARLIQWACGTGTNQQFQRVTA